jgi:hypothetical protein
MNCSESLYWLQLRLDGEPVPHLGGLRDHLASCTSCRELHATAGRLTEGLRLRPVPAPPPGLSAALVDAVIADQRVRFRQRRVAFVGSLAAAACVLIALYFGWPRPGGPNEVAHLTPTTQQAIPTTVQPELNAGPSVREGIYNMGNAYVSLTYRYADETIGQGKVLLPEKLPTAKLTPIEPLPEVTVLEGAGPGVSAPAQVVAKKFENAANSMSFLWRTTPSAPEKH